MALQVWLPLNGTLENKGLKEFTTTTNNTTISNISKFNQSYSFNGTNSYIRMAPSCFSNSTTEFTYTAWIYLTTNAIGCLFSCRTSTSNTALSIFINATNGTQIYFDAGSTRLTANYTFDLEKWYHIAFTYKKGVSKNIYINGQLISSVSTTNAMTGVSTSYMFIGGSQNANATVNANWLDGCLNDIRIYDHCLSTAEIHKLSQGLILHYKLDSMINGIIDSSGYSHHGTIIGSPTINISSYRYDNYINLPDSSTHIQCGTFPTAGFGNSYTFAWWGTKNSDNTMFWGFSDGIRLNGLYKNTLWNTGDSSQNPIYNIGTTTTITAPTITQWHHYVMTGNGEKCYLYVDGQLYGEAKTYKAISGTQIWINGWANATNYAGNMNISDFRIYCTALSADDILQLYNLGQKIDNLQNLHAYEFIEDQEAIQFNKRGQILCDEITEDINTKLYYDATIDSHEIIEI